MNTLFDCHRGWVADIFADGLHGPGVAAHPAAIAALDATPLTPALCRTREPDEVIGWRVLCSCGAWHGRTWLRTENPVDHDPVLRRLHCPSGRLDASATALVLAEWDYHRVEMQALIPVLLAYQDSVSAQRRLVEAVRFVRSAGASWAAIGQVSGVGSAEDAELRFGPEACDMC
ncbi:hypothetical protein ACFVVM_12050 [Nocardia sp. NPDC058176]|uniref:hypothetical protein n=1 Tax=Nocardia sp. NPDC058176 TaxID=3346368 RepID=UPI0036DC28B4